MGDILPLKAFVICTTEPLSFWYFVGCPLLQNGGDVNTFTHFMDSIHTSYPKLEGKLACMQYIHITVYYFKTAILKHLSHITQHQTFTGSDHDALGLPGFRTLSIV